MNCKTALTKSARLAATAGLGLALTFNSVAAPVAAFATAGSLTIENAKKTTYNVYQLMTGDVNSIGAEFASFTAPKVNADNKKAITEVVNEFLDEGNKLSDDSSNYDSDLQDKLGEILNGKKSQEFATKLAKKFIENSVKATATDVQPDESGKLTVDVAEQGYYLVVSTGAADHSAATRAMLVAIDQNTNAELKISAPKVSKYAKVGNGQYAEAVDMGYAGNAATPVTYKLEGTLPGNFEDFGSYAYSFKDILPAGIDTDETDLAKWGVKVYVGDQKLDSGYSTIFETDANKTSTITWSFDDLKRVIANNKITVDADTKVVIEYTPVLDSSDTGRVFSKQSKLTTMPTNTVELTYSASPYDANVKATTEPDSVTASSYNVQLSSVDKDSHALADATFVLKDGTDKLKQVHVDKDGTFEFIGLESNKTYTLTETVVPKGKKRVEDVTFQITTTADSVTKAVKGVSYVEKTDPSDAVKTTGGVADPNAATVYLTVTSVDGINLPLTGQAGIMAGVVAGGLLITVSVAAIARNRREDQAE